MCVQVRLFGLLLALLVAVNFGLAIAWLPAATVCWERYLHCCSPTTLFADSDDERFTEPAPWRTKGPSAALPRHSSALLAPPPPVRASMHGVPVLPEAASRRGRCCSWLTSRFIWRHVYDAVHHARYFLIVGLLAAAAYGTLLATRLESADALPQLFDDSHNVQQFLNMWSSNFTDESLFACAACLRANSGVDRAQMDVASSTALPIAAGSVQARPGGAAPAAALSPQQPTAALGLASPLDTAVVDEAKLRKERVDQNTMTVAVVWGVAAVTGDETDPFATDSAAGVTFDDTFDLGVVAQQRAVVQQVRVAVCCAFGARHPTACVTAGINAACCVRHVVQGARPLSVAVRVQLGGLVDRTTGAPQPGREALVSKLRWDVLAAVREYCATAGQAQPFCAALDGETHMPTGTDFHRAVWAMLSSEFAGDGPLKARVRAGCRPSVE